MEVIRVSIGTEPKQYMASEVLKASILRRTDRRVEFVESWTPGGGWHAAFAKLPRIERGTAFNLWRWVTPSLWSTGKAIYLDADQVVMSDIAELWDSLGSDKTVACVCDAVGVFGKRQPEPDTVQTSVMVMWCELLTTALRKADPIGRVARKEYEYAKMMQAKWLPRDEVQPLDPGWNHFGIFNDQTKLLHWSHVATQPYRNPEHATASVFRNELVAAVDQGYISVDSVDDEVRQGHLAGVYGLAVRK